MINSTETQSRKKTAETIVLLVYIALITVCVLRHERWRDEAQAWLMVRDLNFSQLLGQMKYEGHPCLWHILLMPLAKLGAPYWSMNILSAGISCISAALLLYKARFSLILKSLLIFSASFIFNCGINSRSYCLIPLFLFLNAIVYPDRHEKPILFAFTLAGLVHTHIAMIGMAFAESVIWMFEALRNYRQDKNIRKLILNGAGLGIVLASAVALILLLMGSTDSSAYGSIPSDFKSLIENLILQCKNYFDSSIKPVSVLLGAITVCAVIAALFFAIREKSNGAVKPLAILMITVFVQIVIGVMIHKLPRHTVCVICSVFGWLLWTADIQSCEKLTKRSLIVAFCAICSVWFINNTASTIHDLFGSYSDSKNVAEFVNEQDTEKSVFISNDAAYSTPIIVYLEDAQLFKMSTGQALSFTIWDTANTTLPDSIDSKEITAFAKEINSEAENAYLIVSPREEYYENLFGRDGFELVYKTTAKIRGTHEEWEIYQVNISES